MLNEPTNRKIDFFGGTHGNFLELAVNHAIDQNPYDISKSQFTVTGACHNKLGDNAYIPTTRAAHWSCNGYQPTDNDWMIRIVPTRADMLIVVVNSFLRAGDQHLDIDLLEHDTFKKMSALPKLDLFLKTLIESHGHAESYKRNILRHYFESMFADPAIGLDTMTNWKEAKNAHEFEFASFFYIDRFFESLQKVSKFVSLEFRPSMQLVNLHTEFLEKNQGWHSQAKCSKIIESIIKKQIVTLKLNIIEEAWISYKISQIFNVYDLPSCRAEKFPLTTEDIIQDINKGLMC